MYQLSGPRPQRRPSDPRQMAGVWEDGQVKIVIIQGDDIPPGGTTGPTMVRLAPSPIIKMAPADFREWCRRMIEWVDAGPPAREGQ